MICGEINPKKLIPPTTEIEAPANITDKMSNTIFNLLTLAPNATATLSPNPRYPIDGSTLKLSE